MVGVADKFLYIARYSHGKAERGVKALTRQPGD